MFQSPKAKGSIGIKDDVEARERDELMNKIWKGIVKRKIIVNMW